MFVKLIAADATKNWPDSQNFSSMQ